MDLLSKLSDELFRVLKGSGRKLKLYNSDGIQVYNPSEASKFFSDPDKSMITIDSGNNKTIKMFVGSNTNISEMQSFITTVRNLATKYSYLFNIRKYGKTLSPRDFAFQAESITNRDGEILNEVKNMPYKKKVPTLVKTITLENKRKSELLAAVLKEEFGAYSNYRVYGNNVDISDSKVFDMVKTIIGKNISESLTEGPDDKFLAFARIWVSNRLKNAGVDDIGADFEKQSEELAKGLKSIVAGQVELNIDFPDHIPEIDDEDQDVAFKVGLVLQPRAAHFNDDTFNFLSDVADKMEDGGNVSSNEKFFAKRVALLVDDELRVHDNTKELPEIVEFNQWLETEDMFSRKNLMHEHEYGDDGDNGNMSEDEATEFILDNFDLNEFLENYGSDFNFEFISDPEVKVQLTPEELNFSEEEIFDSLNAYIHSKFEQISGGVMDVTDVAKEIFKKEVKPFLMQNGYDNLSEDCDVLGGDQSDDFIDDVTRNDNEDDQNDELDHLRRLSGLK